MSEGPTARELFADPRHYLAKDFNIVLRTDLVRQLVGDAHGLRILDLGCGDGRISRQFVDECAHLTWVDASAGMLAVARSQLSSHQLDQVDLVEEDVVAFRPRNTRFDLVLCLGVLAHVGSSRALFDTIANALTPEGRAIVQLSDGDLPIARALRWVYTVKNRLRRGQDYLPRATSGREIIAIAAELGLDVTAERTYWPTLPGMGRLPNRWLLSAQRYSADRPWLATFGSERIVLFAKS
jgi:predicted TPR repeat methyltransferase